jgi:hypothetical protein
MAIPIDKGRATRKTTIEARKSLMNVSRKFDSLFNSLTELRRAIISSVKRSLGTPPEGVMARIGNARADFRGVDGIGLEVVSEGMIRRSVATYRHVAVAVWDGGQALEVLRVRATS